MSEQQAEQIIELLYQIANKLDSIQQNTDYIINVKKEVENISYAVDKIKSNI